MATNVTLKRVTNTDGTTTDIHPTTDWAQIESKPSTFTPTSHTHTISDVTNLQTSLDAKAPLASPALTGTPTAPTAAVNTNSTQIATTAYVQGEITDLIGGAPGALDTLNELAAAINDDSSFASTVTTNLAGKLSLTGGTMTGDLTLDGADLTLASGSYQHLARSSYITFYGDNSVNHSIASRNKTYGSDDDIRINTYGALLINLDSNNNNSSNANFEIGRHGGSGTISDWLLTLDGENGDLKATSFSSDGNGKFYAWRAVDNTSSGGAGYYRIANISGSQSTRFQIEVTGRSQGYGDGNLPNFGKIIGQLNNDNNYDVWFFNNSTGTSEPIQEVGTVDDGTTGVNIWIKVSSFSEVAATAVITDGNITVYDTNSFTSSEPTGYTAVGAEYKMWNAGNDGSGSGLDADTVDGIEASSFLRSDQNDTMTGDLTLSNSNPVLQLNDTGTTTGDAYIDYQAGTSLKIHAGGDALTFVAGNAERARIASNGKVGIGTIAPGSMLHIVDSTSGSDLAKFRNDTDTADITIKTTSGAVGVIKSGAGDPLQLSTNGSDTQGIRIDTSGNVGIGTTSPASTLDVRSDDGLFITTATNAPTNGAQIRFSDHSSQSQYGFIKYKHANQTVETEPVNSDDGFIIGGSETNTVVSIQGALNVDGQTNFENQVEVDSGDLIVRSGTVSANSFRSVLRDNSLENQATNGNSDIAVNYYGYAGGTTQYRDFNIYDGKTNLIAQFDGSSGKVGIGTTSPGSKLQVNSTGTALGRFFSTGNGDTHGLYINVNETAGGTALDNNVHFASSGSNSGSFTFATGNDERVRIQSNGNVGIGTTSPSYKLDVAGDINITGNFKINGTNISTGGSGYTHPSHPGDDINIDTGALTGATVISDLDFNITSDTEGHITDANATVSTRELTASDIGAAAASHTHGSYDNAGTLTGANVYSQVAVTDGIVTGLTSRTLTASDIGAAASSHTHDDRYYTESEVDTLLDAKAESSHSHGNLSSTGGWTGSPQTIAGGDYLVIGDASNSSKLSLSNTQFGTGTTNFLRQDGTWAAPEGSEYEWQYVDKVTGATTLTYSSMSPSSYEYKFVVEVQTNAEDTSNPYIKINNDSANEYSYQYSSVTQTAETTETVLNAGDALTTIIYTGADLSSYSSGGTNGSTIHRAEFIYSLSPQSAYPGNYSATVRGWAHTHWVSTTGTSYDGMVQSTFVGTKDNILLTEANRIDYTHNINIGTSDSHEMRVYRRARK